MSIQITEDTRTDTYHSFAKVRQGLRRLTQRSGRTPRADSLAREWDTKYRDFYSTVKEGILLIDATGHIVEANPALLEMLGYTMEELKRLTYLDLTPPRWHALEAHIVQTQVYTRGYSDEYEKEYLCKDGSSLPVSIRICGNLNAQGRLEKQWAIVRDITERKHTQQVLEAATEVLSAALQAKEQMIQNVSHELRTPLTHIQGNAEMLLQNMMGDLNAEQTEAVAVILAKTEHLSRLVNDLLLLRTPEPDAERLAYQPLNLADLVSQAVAQCQVEFVRAQVSVHLSLEVGEAMVLGERQCLQQCLAHLLNNALKFTPRGGSVDVAVSTTQIGFQISVADTGPGIPATDLERIFERFYQVDGSRTRRYGGMGLGLAISRQLVEAHQGRIWCESSYGKGATFYLLLPRYDPEG